MGFQYSHPIVIPLVCASDDANPMLKKAGSLV